MTTTHTDHPHTFEVSVVVPTASGRPKIVKHWSATGREVAALLEQTVQVSGGAIQVELHDWIAYLPRWMQARVERS